MSNWDKRFNQDQIMKRESLFLQDEKQRLARQDELEWRSRLAARNAQRQAARQQARTSGLPYRRPQFTEARPTDLTNSQNRQPRYVAPVDFGRVQTNSFTPQPQAPQMPMESAVPTTAPRYIPGTTTPIFEDKPQPAIKPLAAPLPQYKKGGKVKKTGPAIVHKGEVVITAAQAKKPAVKKVLKTVTPLPQVKAKKAPETTAQFIARRNRQKQ